MNVLDELSGQKPEERVMPVNEQLLTSYIIDLNNLERLFAKLSTNEVSSNREDLLHLLKSLRSVTIRLEELLISELKTRIGGLGFDVT